MLVLRGTNALMGVYVVFFFVLLLLLFGSGMGVALVEQDRYYGQATLERFECGQYLGNILNIGSI